MRRTVNPADNGQSYMVAKPRLRSFLDSEQCGGATYSDIGREAGTSAKTVASVFKGARCTRKTAVRVLKGCAAVGYKGALEDSFQKV
jgi:hypothetical protein